MPQKPTLNQADVGLIGKLLDKRFEKVDKRFAVLSEYIESIARQAVREEAVTKAEFEERIKHLPTKEEFYASQDRIMGEIKTMREEQAAHMMLHDSMEKRINRVEKKVGLSSTIS